MLMEYILFLAKIATFVIAIFILLAGIIAIASKGKKEKARLEVKNLNEKFQAMEKRLRETISTKSDFKTFIKAQKKANKKAEKSEEKNLRHRIFVLNFIGDIKASGVKNLREEVTAILTVATPKDEVVLRLESPGGLVHSYGLAASELERIRKNQITLTVIVDKVAASGGYMMACVGSKILSAPFAVLGSIGVLAQLPNFHEWLEKHHISFEQITAGQYKRTLSLFGKNTSEGRHKFQEEVDEAHELFKVFVRKNRPVLNINEVATGEHWYGTKAMALRLVDGISTSDDYLLNASHHADIYEIAYTFKKTMGDKLSHVMGKGVDGLAKLVSPPAC